MKKVVVYGVRNLDIRRYIETFLDENYRITGYTDGHYTRDILDGKTQAAPYKQGNKTACDYCPYHGVCGFDLKVSGYRFRRFPALKPAQVWEQIMEGGDEDEVDSETEGGN